MIRVAQRLDRPPQTRSARGPETADFIMALMNGALHGLMSWRANNDPYELYRAYYGQDSPRNRSRNTSRATSGCRPRPRSEPSSPSACSERPGDAPVRASGVPHSSRNSRSPSVDSEMPPLEGDEENEEEEDPDNYNENVDPVPRPVDISGGLVTTTEVSMDIPLTNASSLMNSDSIAGTITAPSTGPNPDRNVNPVSAVPIRVYTNLTPISLSSGIDGGQNPSPITAVTVNGSDPGQSPGPAMSQRYSLHDLLAEAHVRPSLPNPA